MADSKKSSLSASSSLKNALYGAVVAIAGLLALGAQAKTLTWQSTSSTSFETAANWFDEGTGLTSTTGPTNADVCTINSTRGATAQPSITLTNIIKNLMVGNGFTLTLSGANGALNVGDSVAGNSDVTVQNGGTMINSSTANVTFNLIGSSDKLRLDAGGTYVHNTTKSFTTPVASTQQDFDAASTFIWRGASGLSSSAVFSGRTFGNVLFESTSGNTTPQTATGTGAATVNGNLWIGASGAGTVTWNFTALGTTSPWTVAGNIVVGSGSTLGFANLPITLSGNLTNNGTMNVETVQSNTFTFNGAASVVAGSSAVTFGGGFVVNSGKSVTLLQNATVNSNTTVSGTLSCGTSVISGTGSVTVANSGTLGIGSTAGIASSGATGNIQSTGTRTFNAGASYIYNGSAAQVTGNGLPASVNNLTINNTVGVGSGGVTLSAGVTVTNQLGLTAGRLITAGNQVIVADAATVSPAAGSSTSYVDGNLQKAYASTGTKTFTFPIGTGAVFAPCALTNLVVTATGNITASTTNSEHPNIGTSTLVSTNDANRYWTMTAGGGLTASSFSAICTPDNTDLDAGATIASFAMETWNGSSWALAASSSVSGNAVTGNGFSTFGDFAVGKLQAVSTNPSGVGNSTSTGRGGTTLLTVTVNPGTNPGSTGLAVTADLSGIGGSSTQTLYDDGTHGDATGGDNVFSFSATVSTGTSFGIKSLPASITDAQSRSGSTTISVNVVGASRVWSGSGADDNWSTSGNWSGNVAPISPLDSVDFTGSTRTTPSLDTSRTVPYLTFDSGASSFTLGASGGSTLTLNGPGITNASANAQAVNIPIIMGSAVVVEAAGAGTLTLGGTVTNGGNLLTVDGANGSAITGAISGGGALTKTGVGSLALSGANTYGGATTISGGTVSVAGGSAIPDASAVTLANVSGVTLSLSANETAASLAGAGPSGGTVSLGGNNLTVGGTSTYSGAVSGSGKLVHTGAGTLTLTNSGAIGSSFTTRIEGGTVDFNNNGLAISGLLGGGNTVELAGGTLQLSGNVQANLAISFQELDIYSSSTLSINRNSAGTSSTSPTFGFPLDFKSTATLSFAYNDRIIGGTTTFSAANDTLEGEGTLALGAFGVTISGIIGEAGGSHSLTKSGAGTLTLSSINTYSGNTTNLGGAISLNATSTFGNGTGTLVLGGGDVLAGSSRAGAPITNPVLVTAGTNTIYGNSTATAPSTRILPFSGTFAGTGGTLRIGNAGLSNNTFQARLTAGGFTFPQPVIIGDASFDTNGSISQLVLENDNTTSSQVFSGNISGTGSILRDSATSGNGGTTVLSGSNTFTGGIVVAGGLLGLGSSSTSAGGVVTSGPVGTGTLEIDNDPFVGIFASGGARTVENRIFLSAVTTVQILGADDLTLAGTWNIGGVSKTLNVTNSGVTTISGPLTNTAALTKAGSGTLVLSGANANTGAFTVAAGTLVVNSTLPSTSLTVNTNGTLSGIGSISGAATVNGGNLTPGAGNVGTLTFGNNLTLSANSTNNFTVTTAGGSSNGVVVTGTLTPNSSVIKVTTGSSLAASTNTLFTYTAISGAFSATPVLDVPAAFAGDIIDDGAGHINLVIHNHAPVAPDIDLGTVSGVPATLKIIGGKRPPTDVDGDVLTVTSVSTPGNGTATTDGTNVVYTPTTDYVGTNSFTYTVSDPSGATATGTVTVTVALNGEGHNKISGPTDLGGGNFQLNYAGIPGSNYALDWTGNLTPPITWVPQITNTADATGMLSFTNHQAGSPNFWRTRYVP